MEFLSDNSRSWSIAAATNELTLIYPETHISSHKAGSSGTTLLSATHGHIELDLTLLKQTINIDECRLICRSGRWKSKKMNLSAKHQYWPIDRPSVSTKAVKKTAHKHGCKHPYNYSAEKNQLFNGFMREKKHSTHLLHHGDTAMLFRSVIYLQEAATGT